MQEQLYALAAKTVAMLKERNLTLSSAESCTGGMFGELVTSVSGASQVFELGIVSYSSRIKNEVLGVSKGTLDTLGAVSEQTAIQMAENVMKLSSSDIAVSVTGVAGPSPSEGKAVGTVYVALSAKNHTEVRLLNISPKSRDYVRQRACEALFNMISEFIKKEDL